VAPDAAIGLIGQGPYELAHVVAAYESLSDVDVIHDHTICGPLIGPARTALPIVATHHGVFDAAARRIFADAAQHVHLVAISQCQASSAPEVPVAAVIHHGVDVADVPLGAGDGGYLAYLGRMVPEKGAHRAIRIARDADRRLLIAAKMREPAEQEFFDSEVRPLLGGDIEYIGELGTDEKRDLLCGASALLNPIDWPEPFGMVMIESLACGTPVVTRAVGAAPEIVAHGQVGFLGRTDKDLTKALARVDELDRLSCRTWAAHRFSLELMAKAYEECYLSAIEG
jgi:glycosyltransferase involved in cell wall biosynthesis